MKVEVVTPEEYTGVLSGLDITKRNGLWTGNPWECYCCKRIRAVGEYVWLY